ncbi:Glyoxalase superfamily enzyme, possibly 3-demethylubiquinone-9 3-methyltransferase [Dyadobacter koreensis]|uniref:Glyoxalase superfamily enzyme, possibly 3-demethylubiquinone-9 3-methyltransferase n=1 Tax=Dyadobacter koreensis TaxID=408657 RepID=A0A1H6XQK3_9BACT|nr:VOC family protein [Dyadobacter koreensis]SEJ29047.1 Glyoxalase superfamily enzyme, possibly 3-demethylubiquinone-9 3-methyltransferase [Dyadobacter koreensis]
MENRIVSQKITPNLWFDNNAEEAVRFYVSVFGNSQIGRITRYGNQGQEIHKMPEGTVMTIQFNIEGQEFVALNGGPIFQFSESVSFIINCETQDEVDYFWEKLSEGGDVRAQECGWLKDKFGLSWQVVPTILTELMLDNDQAKANRVMAAMLKMKKLDIQTLKDA